MPELYSIVLDTTEPQAAEFQTFLTEKHITIEVLRERGDGGGFPECLFIGSRADLLEMVETHFTETEEFFNQYAERETPCEHGLLTSQPCEPCAKRLLAKYLRGDIAN